MRYRKQARRAAAQRRQRAYDALTPHEKLERLDRAGHRAVKQRILLHEAIVGVRWA